MEYIDKLASKCDYLWLKEELHKVIDEIQRLEAKIMCCNPEQIEWIEREIQEHTKTAEYIKKAQIDVCNKSNKILNPNR